MNRHRIYLDNNATTPIDPRVLEVVVEELKHSPANPSSVHSWGRAARGRLNQARSQIAAALGVKERELTFTSGATESLNTLLLGLGQGHIITSSIEHSAILQTTARLEKSGTAVTYLPTGLWGAVRPEDLERTIRPETRLIILGAANSETGVKNPIAEIGQIAKRHRIPFVLDVVGLFGKEPFTIPPGVTALVLSGHKIHGSLGIGLTWISNQCPPLFTGGNQEFGRRAGTENLPAILGLAKAIELLANELPTATARMEQLRNHLETELKNALPSLIVNGQGPRVANTSNLCFPGIDGESLLMQLDQAGIAASLGSACSSGALEPSHVLRAMGIPTELARSSLRFSLSRMTTHTEIHTLIDFLSNLFCLEKSKIFS